MAELGGLPGVSWRCSHMKAFLCLVGLVGDAPLSWAGKLLPAVGMEAWAPGHMDPP